MKYPEYEATQIAQNVFLWYDFENQEVPGKEYIEMLEYSSPFADKLRERAVVLSYSGDLADMEALRAFLFQLLQREAGIINEKNARVWKENLRNWLVPKKGNPAPVMPGKRESVYLLCFALRMNALEAGEFFIKGYLERPYNFKDLKETVYFYCLNNGLHYADAVDLYHKAKAIPFQKDPLAETDTATIGRMVSEFHDEEAFLDYIRQNRWSFETRSISAKKKITELITQCKRCATIEFNAFRYDDQSDAIAVLEKKIAQHDPDDPKQKNTKFDLVPLEDTVVDNAESLLSIIYGYYSRAINNDAPEYIKTINKNSHFPKLIRENMLANAQQLAAVQKGTAPDSIMRNALVLFSFYYFYSNAKANNYTNAVDLFDEFVDEVDTVLIECGFGQLYWRNPYDWMIGYCACAAAPIDELRNLISEFFLDDETIYPQFK